MKSPAQSRAARRNIKKTTAAAKRKRQARHIAKRYKSRGSGSGKKINKGPARKGGGKGGRK